nr:hypothetical protein [Tanacetum cinerariifolium]
MHTRASNSELVEPLLEPERTLNRRLRQRNKRVPLDQRNNPPQHLRVVYPLILNINYFHHFLNIHRNYDPMDDEPMWAVDHVVALTPGFAITIPEIANKFSIKACGIFLYETPNQAYQLLEDKVLLKLDWAKNQKTKSSLKKTVAFAAEGSSNSDTDKIMSRMDFMTIKMDAHDRDSNRDNWCSSKQNNYNRGNYGSNAYDKSYDLQRQFNDFMKSQQSTNIFVKDTFMDLKTQLETVAKIHQASIQNLETKFNRLADKQSGRPSRSLPSNTQPNPRDEGSKILYSIEGTILEEEIFSESNKFIAMVANENYDSESNEEEPKLEKTTINTDYKIKTSLEEPPMDLEV